MPRQTPIPDVPKTADRTRFRFDSALKENLEVLTGRRAAPVKLLEDGASNDQIIAKINEVIARLQGSDASTS